MFLLSSISQFALHGVEASRLWLFILALATSMLDPPVCTDSYSKYPYTYVTTALKYNRAEAAKIRSGRCLIGTLFGVQLICSL